VTPNRSTAHHRRVGTVGAGGICAADTELSKRSDVRRNETVVGPSKIVVGHTSNSIVETAVEVDVSNVLYPTGGILFCLKK